MVLIDPCQTVNKFQKGAVKMSLFLRQQYDP